MTKKPKDKMHYQILDGCYRSFTVTLISHIEIQVNLEKRFVHNDNKNTNKNNMTLLFVF